MARGGGLGREFRWLWAAYAVSAFGTRLSFDALPLIAVLVLHVGPTEVSALAATGLAVGAAVAVPLGPWVEFRRKRPVMITMDLVRCAALLTVPAAYALDLLTFPQLLLVSMVVAVADIVFTAASGACLKSLVPPEHLLAANGRFEATTWTTTMLGPPLGGAAIGLFGPVTTLLTDAASYLLSAAAIRAIGGKEPHPVRPESPATPAKTTTSAKPATTAKPTTPPSGIAPSPTLTPTPSPRLRPGDLLDGWRYILADPALRPLFLNTVLVNALIMAPAPLLLILMVGELGFAPWQYGLAFAVPCVGGLIGSRLSRRLVDRHGHRRVIWTAGTLRACWGLGLAFIGPGPGKPRPRHGRRTGPDRLHQRLQPGDGHPTPHPDPAGPRRPHPHRLVGHRQTQHRRLDRPLGHPRRPHHPRTAITAAGLLLLATPLLLLPYRRPRQPSLLTDDDQEQRDQQNPRPLPKN